MVAEARCRKHPKHRQSPGVCSSCLRERLSQLNNSSNKANPNSFSSTSSSEVSSDYSSASSASSPVEVAFNGYDRVTFVYGKRGLLRSRTIAVVTEKRTAEEMGKTTTTSKKKKQKKGASGFWSKLIKGTTSKIRRKDQGEYLHSKTYKEETAAAGAWGYARK